MFRGFFFAILVHVLLLGAFVFAWPAEVSQCERMINRLEKDQPGLSDVDILMRLPQCASVIDVPIDMVEIGLVTDIAPVPEVEETQEVEETVPEEAPEPETEPEVADDEPVEEEIEVNETRAEEQSEEELLVEDEQAEPEPEKVVEEEPKPEPKKKPELVRKAKPKSDDDLGFLDDFEDQLKSVKTERRAAPEEAPPPINRPVLKDVQEPRKGAGERRGNTASLQAAIRRQIGYCWNGVADLPKEDQIDVLMRIELNRDGMLAKDPRLMNPTSRPIGRSGIPVDLALRAVLKCQPYKLPEDSYDQWKQIDVTIGPKNE